MNIEGSVGLVTGANRGLGKAFAEALLAAGAAKVYAGARNPSTITDPRLVPIKLDVTSRGDIAAAAAACGDVSILINNAGIMLLSPMLAADAEAAMRAEMEVNVFGTQAMIAAFAPVLAANGGGAIINMLSVTSLFTGPFLATYSASKHAALAVNDGARMQLKAQGTQVVAVYAGFVDTDMAAGVEAAKTSPRQVAERSLDGVRTGKDHVLADNRADEIWTYMRNDPAALEAVMQQNWDNAQHAPKP